MLKRIAYPEWCEVDVDADDAQTDYEKYRELFKIMFKNIALIKPVRQAFLQRLSREIESIQIGTTPVNRAEVSLLAVIELHQCIPGEFRERNTPDNPYCALI